MKKLIPILLLLAAGGVAAYFFRAEKQDPNSLRISGNLEMTQVDIAFKMAGKISELLVREGDFVKAGVVIARLDRDTLALQRQREEAGVAAAQSGIAQLGTAIIYQRELLEREIAVRKTEIAAAEAQLNNLLAGSRKQEKSQANAVLEDARARYQQAKNDQERAERLFKNEDISRAQYDVANTNLLSATATLRSAEQRVSLVEEGPRKQDIDLARAQLDRAKAALNLTMANAEELKRKQQEMGARQAEMKRANASVAVYDSQLNDTIATSPIDGVVLVKSLEAGEVAAAGATVVTIADIEHPWLRGYVPETQIGRVKIGQKVKLRTDSFKDRNYEGQITYISSQAEFTPKQIQTQEERVKQVYRVKITVDNKGQELKLNMPVDAVIDLSGN